MISSTSGTQAPATASAERYKPEPSPPGNGRPSFSELEQAIDNATLWLVTAKTPDERRGAWNVLRELVSQRSAERVHEMEVAQGLADRALDRIDATRIHNGQTVDEFLRK